MAESMQDDLRDLLDGLKNRFFLCNTDRKNSIPANSGELERKMHSRGYAAAWEKFDYPSHMEMVKSGDAIFMFAKGGVGVVGIGRAKGGCEVLEPDDPGRIGGSSEWTRKKEWRVPVDWLDWRHDHDGCRISTPPRQTFLEVTGNRFLRIAVRGHFLGAS